jgi:hypothetical protein
MHIIHACSAECSLSFLFFVFTILVHDCIAHGNESAVHCKAEEVEREPINGAVLLQVAGTSRAGVTQGVATTSSIDGELTQYTKLKQRLAQSEESARKMKQIDDELDSRLDEAAHPAETSEDMPAEEHGVSLVDTESQEVLAAQGSQGMNAWTVEGIANPKPHVSLIEALGRKVARKVDERRARSLALGSGRQGKGGKKSRRKKSKKPEEDDSDSSESVALTGISEWHGTRGHGSKWSAKEVEVEPEPISEDGYLDVVSERSNKKMEHFVKRVATSMSFRIIDEGSLKGVVPYYSGQKATQSLAAMRRELLKASLKKRSWLAKKSRPKHVLLQTEASQHQAENGEKPVSLLHGTSTHRTHRDVHKVPGPAEALFASRGIVILVMIGLASCLCCVQAKKPSSKEMEYEDLLNMSPTPPDVNRYSRDGKAALPPSLM